MALDTLRAAGWRGADRVLTAWGRANRYAGSGDRAAVADLVYDALRRRRSLGARLGAADPDGRALMLALAAEGDTAESGTAQGGVAGMGAADGLFTGARFAPAPLTAHECAALLAPAPEPPEAVRLDLPDAIWPELRRSLGADLGAVAALLQTRAAVDLRVNLLRADMPRAIAALAEDGVTAAPGPLSPTCLRVSLGARKLRGARAYLDGLTEVQDAASQAVADMARAAPGETVLDYCAGGGGKALALAAAMGGRGRIIGHDRDPRRMRDLPARAARAGCTVEVLPGPPPPRLRGACDLVFVDAPCSGVGAWRRNPDAKWTLTWPEVEALAALQRRLIAEAAAFVAPAGRLVYATCSMLRIENEDALSAMPAGWTRGAVRRLTPLDGGDGFFAAVLHAPGS
jgi:16S rRNA (cytosine967-C5)-methyltransferase